MLHGGCLSDLKVIEYAEFISGPYCTKLLADFGAEVIKIETPRQGDKARYFGPFPDDRPDPECGGLYTYLNINKLGVTINVNKKEGLGILHQLLELFSLTSPGIFV